IQMLPKFCFPFDIERYTASSVVQNFTFALTDLEGNQRFGFCRLAGGFRTCLCILSYLPWFEVFYKILNNIADHLAKEQVSLGLLDPFRWLPPPPVSLGPSMTISQGQGCNLIAKKMGYTWNQLERMAQDRGLWRSRNLTEFVVAVDVPNMLQLYGSMLYERRILLTSSKLSTLTACVQASSAMLYPMYWQHIYIPTLPPHLLDYCW
uniref:UDENN domain-containing protein n=1 Tax=Chelonoidis abingdonii TaxID=106734 RepID=A0A8C0G5W6_CHEAB